MTDQEFDAARTLSRLKDFQRRTVDYVFRRMYLDEPPARRFLVADEVGLGKTLVASGIIARAIEHLLPTGRRIDVVYVCSNLAIARQNIRRLNVSGANDFQLATRLTLLPTLVHELARNPINFVSFTPGTALDHRSRGGVMRERAILYRLLHDEPGLRSSGLLNMLQGGQAGRDRWRACATQDRFPLDNELATKFRESVHAPSRSETQNRLMELCETFGRYRESVPEEEARASLVLVGELRHLLADVCLHALKPDLVILDEFQRFRDLLDAEQEASDLAQSLFRWPDVRVLLLSATPYKMLTLDHESKEDHYEDFLNTLKFLFEFENPDDVRAIAADLQRMRLALYAATDEGGEAVTSLRESLQERLLRVMVRTERVRETVKRDAMVAEPPRTARLEPRDLDHAAFADRVARTLGAPDSIEYWKSSPYLLNFLRDYEVRKRLDAKAARPSDDLLNALRTGRDWLLMQKGFEKYAPVDPANARLRSLSADTLDRGLWRVLWIPPSLPYSEPAGAYADVEDATKALVFSAWHVVPNAISALLSYEAERRMLGRLARKIRHSELHDRAKPLLQFDRGADGSPRGMSTVALLYPSPTLARHVDPLRIALNEGGGSPLPAGRMLECAEKIVSKLLGKFETERVTGPPDPRWYWAAPAFLDRKYHQEFFPLRDWDLEAVGSQHVDDGSSGFREHLGHLVDVVEKPDLGRRPDDLARVVAELALAAPGTCALRALRRIAADLEVHDPALLSCAARVADGFRTLFNVPETIVLLRSSKGRDPYWRRTLHHGLTGNLQAVLDEQVHVLKESLGLIDPEPRELVREVGNALSEALSIRTSSVSIDEIVPRPNAKRIDVRPFQLRSRFALRFGDIAGDAENALHRAEVVRTAFNSPFRPFVLATTSVGQDGLDFHIWCHAVVHWNLPANPVDLEQREGRVQRYKGHAIRKNVARRFGLTELAAGWDRIGDPWQFLFDRARDLRPAGASDLIPYWVYEIEGGASIERRVPLLPFSREIDRLPILKKSLALYRLVFGQPRQEDLLAHLRDKIPLEKVDSHVAQWQIALAPPSNRPF